MSLSIMIQTWLNQPILDALTNLQKEIQNMATTQAQYDTILTQLGTVVTNEDSTIQTALTAITTLLAKIASGTPPSDLTTEATAAQAMIADIQTQTASLAAAVASATPPATGAVKS